MYIAQYNTCRIADLLSSHLAETSNSRALCTVIRSNWVSNFFTVLPRYRNHGLGSANANRDLCIAAPTTRSSHLTDPWMQIAQQRGSCMTIGAAWEALTETHQLHEKGLKQCVGCRSCLSKPLDYRK